MNVTILFFVCLILTITFALTKYILSRKREINKSNNKIFENIALYLSILSAFVTIGSLFIKPKPEIKETYTNNIDNNSSQIEESIINAETLIVAEGDVTYNDGSKKSHLDSDSNSENSNSQQSYPLEGVGYADYIEKNTNAYLHKAQLAFDEEKFETNIK